MEAEIKSITSLEGNPINYWPELETNFSFELEVTIGPKDEEAGDLFRFLVCTPDWIFENMVDREFGEVGVLGHSLILVKNYDFIAVKTLLEKKINALEGKDWDALSIKISRLGYWEYA